MRSIRSPTNRQVIQTQFNLDWSGNFISWDSSLVWNSFSRKSSPAWNPPQSSGNPLAGSPNGYCFFSWASLTVSYLAMSMSSVIAWGKIKPKLKNITTTRIQWPSLLLRFASVVAGLASLHCLLWVIVISLSRCSCSYWGFTTESSSLRWFLLHLDVFVALPKLRCFRGSS